MVSTIEIAVIGLLLLIPLEIIFLLIIHSLSKEKVPTGPYVPPPPKKQKYEWETYINRRPLRKPEPKSNASFVAIIILSIVAILVLTGLYFASGPLIEVAQGINLSREQSNVTMPIVDMPPVNLTNASATNFSIDVEPFINHTFAISADLPINSSELPVVYQKYETNFIIIIAVLLFGAIALASFFIYIRYQSSARFRAAASAARELSKEEQKARNTRLIAIILIAFGLILLVIQFRSTILSWF